MVGLFFCVRMPELEDDQAAIPDGYSFLPDLRCDFRALGWETGKIIILSKIIINYCKNFLLRFEKYMCIVYKC